MNYELKRPLSPAQLELREKLMKETGNTKYKAVSMKLSDVLILLPFTSPYDLFGFMEEEFRSLSDAHGSFTYFRTTAEEAALKKLELPVRVTLEKIYSILQKLTGISDDAKTKLMELECELMERFSFPRETGKCLFRHAKSNNKRVIIISETVYPRQVIQNILEKCGYSAYDGLIVVNEIKNCTGKTWFDETVSRSGISAGKLLHIGGDVAFDVELPIMNGAKALLMNPPAALMRKSGRLADYVEESNLLEFDNTDYLVIKSILGLYTAYGFDSPQNKVFSSDFCDDAYMMGFLILGSLSKAKDFKPSARLAAVINAMASSPEMIAGKEDFDTMYNAHFGTELDKYGFKGCEQPAGFIEKFCAAADREKLTAYLPANVMKKWSSSVKEPDIMLYKKKTLKSNPIQDLADKMFPPETRVRNIVDDIMNKGKTMGRKKKNKRK